MLCPMFRSASLVQPMRRLMRRPGRSLAVVLIATALLTAGCAGQRERRSGTADLYGPGPRGYMIGNPYRVNGVWYYPAEDKTYDKIGFASWYGPGFHGQRTANGESYNKRRFTAAHTTLPMPVLVRVTNLENGHSTILRVNDRGPFVPGRIIDVSEAAANALDFRHDGVARVRVQYVGRADGPPVAAAPPMPSAPAGIPMANAAEATGAISPPSSAEGGTLQSPSSPAASMPSIVPASAHGGSPGHTHARFMVEMR